MSITYSESGVDIDAYEQAKDEFAKIIKSSNAESPYADCVVAGLGSFGAVFDTKKAAGVLGYKNYADVESIDSVGTKVKLAAMSGDFSQVGLDMIGHSTGDVLAQGAIPVVFGDYIAVPKVWPKMIVSLVESLASGCRTSGMIVDLDNLITGQSIVPGDVLIGVASSGLHTNGFSLVNKLFFEIKKYKLSDRIAEFGKTLGEELMTPHRNYTASLREIFPKKIIKGIAHITGGGLPGNVIRILPENTKARIKCGTWEILPIFNVLEKEGQIAVEEMRRTFNMGVGMVLVCSLENIEAIKAVFDNHQIK